MAPQSPIKRPHVLFVIVVFLALLAGFLVEGSRKKSPFAHEVIAPHPTFEPLEVPGGRHVLRGEVRTAAGSTAVDVGIFLYRSEPVPGLAEPLQWAFTDADGRFVIDGLPAARYEVALIQPGHEHTRYAVSVPEETQVQWTLTEPLPPMRALPDIQRAELFGRLLPPGSLEVSVEGYEIVLRPADTTDPLSGALVRRVETNSTGRFRVEKLVAADYFVEVLPPWALGGSWPVLDQVYHRHEPEPPADALLEMRLRTGRVEGTLVDPENRPIEGALIKIWPQGHDDRLWPPIGSDAEGRFVVNDLREGPYRLRIRCGVAEREIAVDVRAGELFLVGVLTMDPSAEVERP